MNRTLPTDSAARKGFPLFSGCIAYFAAALAGVARWSKLGNDKHNPGEPMHHSRGKSNDHKDCILRHLMDLADLESSYARNASGKHDDSESSSAHVAAILDEADALAWRALALSQELHEKYAGAPLAPGARLPEGASVEVPGNTTLEDLVRAAHANGARIVASIADDRAGPIVEKKDPIRTGHWRVIRTGHWRVVKPKAKRRSKSRAKLPGRKIR